MVNNRKVIGTSTLSTDNYFGFVAYVSFNDKTELIKSELASLIFKEYYDNLVDDETALLNLFSKLKEFRDGDASNE